MLAAPDPERMKAVLRQRYRWYMAACVLGPMGFVVVAVVAIAGLMVKEFHVRPSLLPLAGFLVYGAALLIQERIWRCPACKERLPGGLAPPPQSCPRCSIPLADPPGRAWAAWMNAARYRGTITGVYLIVLLGVAVLMKSYHHSPAATRAGGVASVVTQPTAEDRAQLRHQVQVVDHLLAARYPGRSLQGTGADLALLQSLLDDRVLRPEQTFELQCLGVAFGNVMAREMGLHWVTVSDEFGRDPALQYERTSLLVFPLTMISKRVEAGEPVDLTRLLAAMRALVKQHSREADPAPATT